jgi:alkylation response protein AidB-like acyl-CoA dehydrogenase
LEEICKVDASHGTIMSVNNSLFNYALLKFGSEELKKKYLTPVASGKAIGAYSLTEPMSGSDAGTMRSRAVRQGDAYLINGRKSWVTSAPVADYILLFTMTDPENKHRGISAFIIETDQPGFVRGKKEPKLGIRASATSEILFEDYRVPSENRLGAEGDGFKIAMAVLDAGRIGIASQALGISEAAYEASVIYAREREAFGQKIGELADMKTRIEAARLLTYNAAMAKERAKETGERFTLEASMAKLFASETAMFCTHTAIQVHGGLGYSKELPIERYFRDAKITEIYEGTSEIQRLVIARLETGLK